MAAARIQRWALTLGAYSYSIKYKRGIEHSNADALSRLPLEDNLQEPPLPAELVLLMSNPASTAITHSDIRRETEEDDVLSKVLQRVQTGWKNECEPLITEYWKKRLELSSFRGILLRGSRIIIPNKLRNSVLEELHSEHNGVVAMKNLARTRVWWPNMDHEIELKVQTCETCQINSNMPPQTKTESWPTETEPWTRIHLDFAGPVDGKHLLVLVDSTTNWTEVALVNSTSSSNVIRELRNICSRFGLPKCIVTDNGAAFTSEEFQTYIMENGIKHIRTAPYHPCSNGSAERAVQMVKKGLKKVTGGTLEARLARILFAHRITPSAAKGLSPAQALLKRSPRTRLDLMLQPSLADKVTDPSKHDFEIGQSVWARNFQRGNKWWPGTVQTLLGNVMLGINTADGLVRRHVSQVRRRVCSSDNQEGSPLTSMQERESDDSFLYVPCNVDAEPDVAPLLTPPREPRRSGRQRKKPSRLDL